jgi:hypothetical protein
VTLENAPSKVTEADQPFIHFISADAVTSAESAASFFGKSVTYIAASRSVHSFPPSGRAIGSPNSRGHPGR